MDSFKKRKTQLGKKKFYVCFWWKLFLTLKKDFLKTFLIFKFINMDKRVKGVWINLWNLFIKFKIYLSLFFSL